MKYVSDRWKRVLLCMAAGSAFLWIGEARGTQDTGWPREIDKPKAKILVYQPQLESLTGDKLRARAAVSVTLTGAEPTFGAVWLTARVQTDRDTRTVGLLDLDVPDLKFPNATPEQLNQLAEILRQELPKGDMTMSLDRLLTALDLVEKEQASAGGLRNVPPVIRFVEHPAVLVSIDGKPALRPVENSKLMRVVNTPFLIVLETASKTYYLKGGDEWLSAPDIMGPWRTAATPPAQVVAVAADHDNHTAPPTTTSAPAPGDRKPQIIVATEPTELIVSDGPPKYTPISGTGLLYMSNTESDVFMEMTSQQYYVLLAGRWFVADALSGPWSFVRSDRLPADFAKIPPDSEKANVLAQVAGTPEAKDAVQEACIPQTARIDRAKATAKVEYDGEPKFAAIDNTSLEYAVNTADTVVRVDDTYYCCEEAVWYEADSATGPWIVCDSVPREIYTIPPSCPVYPATYVHVYDSTPRVVYVGYTAGYTGSYVYGGTVLFGTGFVYGAWFGTYHYYPRPVTYGWGAHYNSINGNWGFRVGAAGPNGWIVGGYHNGKYFTGGWIAGGRYGGDVHGGWWGHGVYYPVAAPYRGNINRTVNVGNVNIGNRVNVGDRYDRGNRIGQANRFDYGHRYDYGNWNNIYNRSTNLDRDLGQTAGLKRPGDATAAPRSANNVFADRNGDIYRRTNDGWQRRGDNDWNRSISSSRQPIPPSQRPSAIDRGLSPLERDYQARERGTVRTDNYRRYQSYGTRGPSHRFEGGYRGGGFRGGRR